MLLALFLLVTCLFVCGRVMSSTGSLRHNRSKFNRPSRSRTNELGSGDLATKAQIAQWLEKKQRYSTALPVRDLKASDGIALKRGMLVIPPDERNRHILVVAKTGSGKTTRAILPVLYEDCLCPDRTSIVIDSKPEMWEKLVGITRRYNPKKKILLFNPLDIQRSLSWNILAKIETDTDAKLITNTIITATDNPNARADSPFFRNSALQLLNSMMVGLLTDPSERLSMPRVHELLNSGISQLCDWLEAHPQAVRNAKPFIDLSRSGSQNADTILSELSTRLSAWDLMTIRATTALDELDLENLIAEPTLFIIELRESELEMLRPLANVIVIEILRYLTKRAEQLPGQRLPRPVSIVIDEFASSLGRLPDIHVKLNTLRSRNVSIVAAIQSIGQIKANYDKDADSVLAGFSTKIFMPNLDFMDSEWASKETGTMTVRFNIASVGKNRRLIDFFANRNDNLQEQVQQRAVLTPDEIGRPVDNAATFFLPNTPVFQGHLIPYFEVPEMRDRFTQSQAEDFCLRSAPIVLEGLVEPVPATSLAAPARAAGDEKEQLKRALGWKAAPVAVREWWSSIEKKNSGNPSAMLELLRTIERRRLTMTEFHGHYLRAGGDTGDMPLRTLLEGVDRVLLEEGRDAMGWQTASGPAKQWWTAFEQTNAHDKVMLLDLYRELSARRLSIDDVFGVYVHGGASSIAELLAQLDELIALRAAATGYQQSAAFA